MRSSLRGLIRNENNMEENLGRRTPKGKQIATNTTMHGTIQLFENEAGEYYPVVDWDSKPTLVRGEYYPLGNRIQFPKQWGRREGATILLEYKIEDCKRTILDAETELAKLERCLSNVKEWPEFD
jgi:hypothetical protein